MSDTQPTPPEESEDDRVRRLIDERLSQVTGQDLHVSLPGDPDHPETPQPRAAQPTMSLKDILNRIDPRDSESHIELFNHLVDNGRLHKVATLAEGGYMFVYQEPKGASKEGWTAGGTQGDRIVDDALQQAKASSQTLKGLCKFCFSPIQQGEDDSTPVAESPRTGTDPAACDKGQLGIHEFAG